MGNSLTTSFRKFRVRTSTSNQQKNVVQVVKMDGKILELRTSILVKDLLLKYPGLGVAASKTNPESLPLNYELQLGNIYFLLPPLLSAVQTEEQSPSASTGVIKTIRVVITNKQLQDLVSRKISLDSIVSTDRESRADSPRVWQPGLESIPEGN